MALSYVNSSSNKSTTTSVSITKPTNVADGDVMIAFVSSFYATNKTAGTVTAPAGWNTINTQAISTRYQVGLFWKRASSEGISYSFTSTSATQMQGAISAYRGAISSGTPYSVYSNTLYGTSNTTVRAATMTPSSNGLYVVWGGWYYLSGTISLTKPSAMTLLQTQANTNNALTMAHGVFTPGSATGSQDGTAGAAASVKHAYMVEILAVSDTKTQTATARIQIAGNTKTQTATANIVLGGSVITKTQTAIASIQKTGNTKTQAAVARIQKVDITKTQTAVSRIQKTDNIKTQTAVSSILVTGNTSTQTATASIYVAGTVEVVLDSPEDAVTIHNALPTLYFTGTSPDSGNVEYRLQIDTINTFNSTSTGQPLISKYSDTSIYYREIGVYDNSSSVTAVVPAPTGLSDGDLIFVAIRRNAAVDPSDVPAGWTLLQSVLSTYGFWIYYKVASGEGSSWTWTWAASTKTLAYAYAFLGDFDPNDPIQSSTTPFSSASGTAIDIPALTTSVDNTLSLILSSAYSTSTKTFTVPTSPSYVEHSDTGSNLPDFWQAIASYAYPTANTNTGTISYPVSSSSSYLIGCQILINPNPNVGYQSGHPYSSASQVIYTVPTVLASNTYYWRVCAKDTSGGGNVYGSWAAARSFSVKVGMKVWDGDSWGYKPVKIWTGSQWEMKPVKVWDGESWVTKG